MPTLLFHPLTPFIDVIDSKSYYYFIHVFYLLIYQKADQFPNNILIFQDPPPQINEERMLPQNYIENDIITFSFVRVV